MDDKRFANKSLKTMNENADAGYSVIVSNTASEVFVLGDLSEFDYDDPFDDFVIQTYAIDDTSPCHDEGDDALLPSAYNVDDIIGNTRISGPIDMGCYEYQNP